MESSPYPDKLRWR